MKAVLMAGGEGTRLRPVTLTRPKPFVPVGGRPCIDYVLESLNRAGIRDVMVTTHYKPEEIIRHLGGGSRLGMNLAYSVEDTPRGTAGGVKKVQPWIDGTFVVASGDVFADFDLGTLVEFHRGRGAVATMALAEVDNPSEFGIVGTDEEGRITRFLEKPRPEEAFSRRINAGVYVFEPEVLELVPATGPFDFSKQLFPLLLERGEALYATQLAGAWIDIGRPSDLLRASKRVTDRAGGNVVPATARVARTATLRGASLHPGATVGEGALVEDSILLDDARVEDGAIVRKTVVGASARIGSKARLDDCVLGDRSIVPPGGELRGERLDPGATAGAS